MQYRLRHLTAYHYSEAVSLCHSEACLLPRELPWQRVEEATLTVQPRPSLYRERWDLFGNRLQSFTIQDIHQELAVQADSLITMADRPLDEDSPSPPWEEVAAVTCHRDNWPVCQFVLDSPFVRRGSALADYARESFAPGRELIEAVAELNRRIFEEFTYDPHFTTVATPLETVLEERRGVCQDFAHLGLGCLRALGLAARYVSGYLETLPPPGQPRLEGADASHAWLAVWVPGAGWAEFDPTNGLMPGRRHITLAWGRDYGDVAPLKGVTSGGGAHTLTVGVDVVPLEEEAAGPATPGPETPRPEKS